MLYNHNYVFTQADYINLYRFYESILIVEYYLNGMKLIAFK